MAKSKQHPTLTYDKPPNSRQPFDQALDSWDTRRKQKSLLFFKFTGDMWRIDRNEDEDVYFVPRRVPTRRPTQLQRVDRPEADTTLMSVKIRLWRRGEGGMKWPLTSDTSLWLTHQSESRTDGSAIGSEQGALQRQQTAISVTAGVMILIWWVRFDDIKWVCVSVSDWLCENL